MLLLIQPAEVLEHHAPLLGRKTGELIPRRVADFRPCASRPREERPRNVDAVTRRGATGAILLFVRLVAGEAAAGIEQLAIEALLPLDRAAVEPSRFELSGELARFLSECTRGTGIGSSPRRVRPLDRVAVEPSRFERAGELAGLRSECTRGTEMGGAWCMVGGAVGVAAWSS